ncbi:glycerophosphocholine cholinephosphodiesterase ENPP6-like [Octopus vulgaris]|nr:glycerophosphocholine cholinephosphodiesterase ENPP6-like [Octopus vulgaris]
MYRFLLISCVCLTVCLITLPGSVTSSKLLIILLDGFRWDYFDREGLTGYQNFLRMGTRAEYLKNSFPTISYPNYYTIMTGLYSEDHGFIDNKMYDPKHKTEFLLGFNREQYDSYWWDDGDPLWITAKRQNKSSYFYFWPGCEVTIKELKPDYCRMYTEVPSMKDFKDSIKQGMVNFVNNSADLVGIYFELTDKMGHNYGPNSPQLESVLRETSEIIDRLLVQLKEHHLENEVNVILTSDHGMSQITPNRYIDLNPVLKVQDTHHLYGSVFLSIWPKEGKTNQVYNALKNYHPNLTVYLKHDIPERWRLKHHYRVPPIIAVADIGWYVITPPGKRYPTVDGQPIGGYHGYDNEETDMRGIFTGVGPDFRKNAVVPWLNAVDIYQFMCDLLNIEPSPNDGDSTVTRLMRPKPAPLPQPPPPVTFPDEQTESITVIAETTETATEISPKLLSTLRPQSSPLSFSSLSSSFAGREASSESTLPPKPAPSSQAPSQETPDFVKSFMTLSTYTENSASTPLFKIYNSYLILLLAVISWQILQ